FGAEAVVDRLALPGLLIADDDAIFLVGSRRLPGEQRTGGAPTDGFHAIRLPLRTAPLLPAGRDCGIGRDINGQSAGWIRRPWRPSGRTARPGCRRPGPR